MKFSNLIITGKAIVCGSRLSLKTLLTTAPLLTLLLIFFNLTTAAPAQQNQAGSLDASFGTGGKVTSNITSLDNGHAVTIQADNKIVVAGRAEDASQISQFAVLRYNPDGSLDTTFDGDGKVSTPVNEGGGFAHAVIMQADGKILAAGQSQRNIEGFSQWDYTLIRYNADGSLDTSFDGDGKVITDFETGETEFVRSLAIQSDGKIIAAGYKAAGSCFCLSVARYNADGSLDASFGMGGKVLVPNGEASSGWSVKIQPDGKIVVGGTTSREVNIRLFRRALQRGRLARFFVRNWRQDFRGVRH